MQAAETSRCTISPQQLLGRLRAATNEADPEPRVLSLLQETFGSSEITFFHFHHLDGSWSATLPSGEHLSLSPLDDPDILRCVAERAEVHSENPPGTLCFPLFFEEILLGAVKMLRPVLPPRSQEREYDACFTFAALMLSCSAAREARTRPRDTGHVVKPVSNANPELRARRQTRRTDLGNRSLMLSMVQFAPIGIFRTDHKGRCLFLNQRGGEVLGLSTQEALGMKWTQVVHPADQRPMIETWRVALQTGSTMRGECRIVRRDGSALWVMVQALSGEGRSGDSVGCVGMLIDINEQKLAEVSLKEENRSLAASLAAKTAQQGILAHESAMISYAISHDLRAPLRAITGYVRILMEEQAERLKPEGIRQLESAAQNANKIGELIDALLLYTKLGRQELRRTPLDLEKLVLETYRELTRDREKAKAVRLELGKLPKVIADREMIRLAMHHLLDNALKFSRSAEQPHIQVGSREDEGEQVLFVKDNGIGFNALYQEKLFGIFEKLHSTNQFDGNGTGLALVQRVANKHGGRVWAEGLLNQGATFYLSFPNEQKISCHLTSGQ